VFFDAVYFFCFLFACGHVGFFVYGGVGVKYRYGLWDVTHDNEKYFFGLAFLGEFFLDGLELF